MTVAGAPAAVALSNVMDGCHTWQHDAQLQAAWRQAVRGEGGADHDEAKLQAAWRQAVRGEGSADHDEAKLQAA